MRKEFEGDGSVDGDVAAYAKAYKGCEDEEGVVVVGSAQAEAKDGGEEAS